MYSLCVVTSIILLSSYSNLRKQTHLWRKKSDWWQSKMDTRILPFEVYEWDQKCRFF